MISQEPPSPPPPSSSHRDPALPCPPLLPSLIQELKVKIMRHYEGSEPPTMANLAIFPAKQNPILLKVSLVQLTETDTSRCSCCSSAQMI